MPTGSPCPPFDERDADRPTIDGRATAWLSGRPLSNLTSDAVRTWHATLFQGLVPVDYYAGNFRVVDAAMPCLAVDVEVADPAKPGTGIPGTTCHAVASSMVAWERKHEAVIGALVAALPRLSVRQQAVYLATALAAAVGEFIRIHPFLNGNGRTSRLLWGMVLRRFNMAIQVQVGFRPRHPYGEVMHRCMKGDDSLLATLILQLFGAP